MGIGVIEYFVAYEITRQTGQVHKYFKVVRYSDLDSAETILTMVVRDINCNFNEGLHITAFNRV